MDFFKKFLKNNNTVVGLCDLKRRTAINSFNTIGLSAFNSGFNSNAKSIPGGLLYAK